MANAAFPAHRETPDRHLWRCHILSRLNQTTDSQTEQVTCLCILRDRHPTPSWLRLPGDGHIPTVSIPLTRNATARRSAIPKETLPFEIDMNYQCRELRLVAFCFLLRRFSGTASLMLNATISRDGQQCSSHRRNKIDPQIRQLCTDNSWSDRSSRIH